MGSLWAKFKGMKLWLKIVIIIGILTSGFIERAKKKTFEAKYNASTVFFFLNSN